MDRLDEKTRISEKHRRQLYRIFVITILLMIVASLPGIGYQAVTKAIPAGVIAGGPSMEGGVSFGRLTRGTLNVSFNPLLYPISYIFGRGSVFRKYLGAAEFWDHEGAQVAEAAVLGTLFTEFLRNLPFFLVAGVLLTLALHRISYMTKGVRRSTLENAQKQEASAPLTTS